MAADDPLAFYQGMTSSICVGNPSIRRLMWKGCVLTKLVGSLEAGRMTADLRLDWKPFEDLQDHLYTNRGAIQSAAFYFAWFAGTWACLSILVCKRRIWEPKGGRWYVGVVLLPAVVLSGAGAVVFYSNVPNLKPSDVRIVGSASELDSDYLHLRIAKIIKADPSLLQKTPPEIIGSLLANLSPPESQVAAGVLPATNRATGGPIVCEDSPGQFHAGKAGPKGARSRLRPFWPRLGERIPNSQAASLIIPTPLTPPPPISPLPRHFAICILQFAFCIPCFLPWKHTRPVCYNSLEG